MTLDQLLRDVGEHVDTLIDRHLAATTTVAASTTSADAIAPANERENELMTIVEQPPRSGRPAARPQRNWAVIAASAAAVVLLIAGIVAIQRDGGDEENSDIPAPNTLVVDATAKDNRIEKVVFDGSSLWSVRNGSTFLLRMDPTSGKVLESLSLPEAAAPGQPVVHGDALYVGTTHGVVVVDTRSRQIAQPTAIGGGEVWSIAFTTDSVWMVRRQPNAASLERWTTDLGQRLLSIDLGPETAFGIVGVGTSLYMATEHNGLRRYDSTGAVTATVAGIGYSSDMELGDDGTLWIAVDASGELVAVDTATNTARSRLALAHDGALNLEVTPSSVWVTLDADHRLVVVDPATGQVTSSAGVSGPPRAVTLAGGAVWVSGTGWAERFVPG